MKLWTIPVAAAQQFTANDYVSACSAEVEIKCDLPLPADLDRYILNFDEPFHTYDGKIISQMRYNPCAKVHEVGVHGELKPIQITQGRKKSGGEIIELDEPIDCYFFAEYTEDGLLKNVHCTLSADGLTSNKS